jgi:two-component system response regulator
MTSHLVEILLVEDNITDAELTIRELKKNNMANNLVHVQDGQQALDFIFYPNSNSIPEQINRPKLVLLDIKMPKVSGIEVLEKIKGNQDTMTIPVVMLTSSKEDPDIKRCYELGANSYIVKPVNFSSFAEAIKNLGLYWILLNQNPL